MTITQRLWMDADHDTYYFYNQENGMVVAQIHKMAHTKIWLAKIIRGHGDEHYLGQYIGHDFARQAVENYWAIQERTLIE